MKRTHLLLAICAMFAVAISASVALAETKKKSKRSDTAKPGLKLKHRGDGPKALAQKLGVTTPELAAAIKAAHESVGAPDPATREDKDAREAHCLKVSEAVAQKLGVTTDKLITAAKDVAKERLAKDVTSKRLSQAQADAMGEKIDASKCAPLGGPPRGCHGPGSQKGPAGAGGPGGPETHMGPTDDQQGGPEGSES